MADPQADPIDENRPRPLWRSGLVAGVGLLALGLGLGWSQRMAIADTMISAQLQSLHMPVRYRVVELSATHAVLADVVVGNAAHPDFTARRVDIRVGLRGALPGLAGVRVDRARLYGRWQGGRLSFGALDRLWQGGSTGALRLPDLDLALADARVSVTGGHGPVGLAITGQGALRDGFSARVALAAPDWRTETCHGHAGFGGDLRIRDETPRMEGSLRLTDTGCGGLRLARGAVAVSAQVAPTLDGGEAGLAVKGDAMSFAGGGIGALSGPVRLSWRDGVANAVWRLGLEHVAAPGVVADRLGIEGRLRAPSGLARVDGEGTLTGQGIAPDRGSYAALETAAGTMRGTLGAPLIARISGALRQETPGSVLDGGFTFHGGAGGFSAVVPDLRLRGASKLPLIDAQRLTLMAAPGAALRVSGTLRSATPGLPRIEAGIVDGGKALRLIMADYRVGEARIAVPDLVLTRAGKGLRWSGQAVLSGALAPGVAVSDLALPLAGGAAGGTARLWPGCAPLRFGRMVADNVTLEAGAVTLCPVGGAVVASGPGGLRLGARTAGLELSGRMGGLPLRLGAGAVEVAMTGGRPAAITAQGVAVRLGPETHLRLDRLSAQLGAAPGGSFAGMAGALAAVPMEIREGAGQWRYANGALALSDLALRVEDREKLARFGPLVARGGSLTLAGGVVRAQALLREPVSDRGIVALSIAHDLASARGHADLAVDGLTFDAGLQPDRLTALALGSVADAAGRFDGTGRIDWADGKLSSHGRITTQGFDFAGAVGPVKGVAGTLVFTDLLGLVTAPHQALRIGSINPGIEATDGLVHFTMAPGHVFVLEDARWPFLDGHMEMAPMRMQLGGAAERRFEVRLSGVNAAQLITHMELSNLSVSGLFDGHVPLVFDQNGGRVAGGELISRAPGGSVSYVGDLTYRDLSPMANYAFRALRSLKFAQMRIGLDGDLAGEVVTRVEMKGLSQGKGASKNFVTRQIAKLPLEFNVSIHAPFYQLIGSMRSLYDTSYIGDPRERGLFVAAPATIQPSASEHRP